MDVDARTVLWFLLATLLLAALVYVSDYREFAAVLAGADVGYAALAVACGTFTLLAWSIVWHRFFALFGVPVAFRRSVQLLLAGTFLNAVTPLGRFGGEPVVAGLVARRTEASVEQALSSVSSADLANALPFLTLGALSIGYLAVFGTLEAIVADIAVLVVVLLVVAGIAIYLLWFGGLRRVLGVAGPWAGFWPGFGRLQPYVDAAVESGRDVLVLMRDVGDEPRRVGLTVLVSHVAVAGHVGATYCSLLAVGVEPVLPAVFLVVTLSAFLTFSPTPGSTGTFEAGFAALVVAFFPVSAATATSVAILYRVGTYLPGVVLGYGGLLTLDRLG